MNPNEELREFCVICLGRCLSSNVYAILYVPEGIAPFYLRNGQGYVELEHQKANSITNFIAGRPEALIEIARAIGRDTDHVQWMLDNTIVGVWAQLEWFGLRICVRHMWEAQDLWQRGGNRNWRG